MRGLFVAVAVLALAGCGTPRFEGGNELGGVIRYPNRHQGASVFAQAESECAKYGKLARVTDKKESMVFSLIYECVAKPTP